MRGRRAFLAPHRKAVQEYRAEVGGTLGGRNYQRYLGRYWARVTAWERRVYRITIAVTRRKPLLNNGGKP